MGDTKKPEICDRLVRGTGMGAADLYYIVKGYCAQFEKAKKAQPVAAQEPKPKAEQANETARAWHEALKRLEAADPCRPGGKWVNRKICWR